MVEDERGIWAYMGIDTDEGVTGATLHAYDMEDLIDTLNKIWSNWWDGDQEEKRHGI
jgi:hypothetical protein